MRDALKSYGWGKKANVGMARRPVPREAWPHRATAPIPFAWVLQAAATSITSGEFHGKLLERSKILEAPCRIQVETNLQSPENLQPLFAAVQDALAMRLVAFVVPDQALSLSIENEGKDNQIIASVEHLFQRLNAGGTVPSSEEMAYSMIKAYWPEVEEPIRELKDRRMPEARLFMLSVRIAAGVRIKPNPDFTKIDEQLPNSLSVDAVRRIALQGKGEGHAKSIYDFFTASTPDTLKPVLDQVGEWLESRPDRDRYGLPPELHSSIANRSPEVYLLLMWLSRRWCLQQLDGLNNSMRRHVLALATSLHWFRPVDSALATRLIVKELDRRLQTGSDLFRGLLSTIADQDQNQAGILLPLTPQKLRESIGTLPNQKQLEAWRWWRIARDAQEAPTEENRFVVAMKDSRELLMYAQREYVLGFNFDPAHASSEQHDRPWDYDHILPYSKVKGKWNPTRPGLLEWVNCIANLRVWPMEENRSDQATSPKQKMLCPETGILDQKALKDSFLEDSELNAFDLGCLHPFEEAGALAFLNAASERLIRIYSEWHNTLDVAFLSDRNAPFQP